MEKLASFYCENCNKVHHYLNCQGQCLECGSIEIVEITEEEEKKMNKKYKMEDIKAWKNRAINAIPQSLFLKAYWFYGGDIEQLSHLGCGCVDQGDCDCENQTFDDIPMYGWFFMFDSKLDEEWARENISAMEKLGLYCYECEEGFFFGINSYGHCFDDAYWKPLFMARFNLNEDEIEP